YRRADHEFAVAGRLAARGRLSMTDITILVQRLKVAAKNGCCHTLFPDDCLALVEALEKAQDKIIVLQQKYEIDPRTHEIIDLEEHVAELESEVEKWKQEAEVWEKVAEKQLATAIELESRIVTVENMQESAYRAGLTAGWNLGLANNNDGFNKCLAAHTAGIKVEA
uniref:hypothetical protein n=1 Tax=Escherichia coli TaxID=562 RepID=UPI004025964E